jgi:hypothetical protein
MGRRLASWPAQQTMGVSSRGRHRSHCILPRSEATARRLGHMVGRAVALWLTLRSIGIEMSVALVLGVTVATNLLAGLLPIPGGIRIAEAVMISWMVLVGVPEESASAATIVYRLWTFYVPAIEGSLRCRGWSGTTTYRCLQVGFSARIIGTARRYTDQPDE